MKKIISLLVFAAIAVFVNAQDVKFIPSIAEGTKDLVIKFENTSGKTIANCNFLLTLPEGVSLTPKKTKFVFEEGDATEGMTFSIKRYAGTTDKWAIAIYDGEFDEEAGNTIITLPLTADELKGEAVFTEIAFGAPDKTNICRIDELILDITPTAPVGSVDLKGKVKDGNLVFSFENTTGKSIASCHFQFELPEGMTLTPNGGTFKYEKGDATKDLTFSIGRNANQYTVNVSGGNFNESASNTIITLPLQGDTGGKATVSNVSFKDAGGSILGQPDGFSLEIPSTAPVGSVDLKGEVKDGYLVFTFENTTGKTIANCHFQFVLPENVSVKLNPTGERFLYEEGDATKGMIFSLTSNNNKYAITVYNGKFKETASNTIISLPLEGKPGGKATVGDISFGDPDGNNISRPEGFPVDILSTINGGVNGSIDIKGEVKDGSLVFTFQNNTGKTIANCNFLLTLPEGVSLTPKKTKFAYEEGNATEGMTFSIKQYAGTTDTWSIAVYDGEFDENAGNTIISLPLQGKLSGTATVSEIAFGDTDKNNISRPEDFTIDLTTAITGSVDLKGEVKDGNLVFTFENTTNMTVANCNFQLVLPEGMSIKLNSTGKNYLYEEGDATEGMTFTVKQYAGTTDKWIVAIYDGEFDENAGNTIITLPLQGKSGGTAVVRDIAFGDPYGNNISRPDGFSLEIPSTAPVGSVDLKGEVKDGNLIFTFENTCGKTIGNCNFQFELPEDVSVKLNSTGKKYLYEKGDATENMTFYFAFNNNNYTVNIFGGEFNETAGNTIISLPLKGRGGGEAIVSNIAFGDPEANNISCPEDFTIDLPSAVNGDVDLKGEVKDGNLVFTFENNSGITIANCNFQFELPEGVHIKRNLTGKKYLYEEGDATEGMTFYLTSNDDNKYTVVIFGGEFDEKAGNTIISLPLEGIMTGEATVSSIAFGDSDGFNISRPNDFSLAIVGINLKGEIKDDTLIFTYENNSGKPIAACNFQFDLPEGITLTPNDETYDYSYENRDSTDNSAAQYAKAFKFDEGNDSEGLYTVPSHKSFKFEEGDATAGMSFSITFKNNKYIVTVENGEFDENAGNTIITLPLKGKSGGVANVSDIAFGDSNGQDISQTENFEIDVDGVDLRGEMKNGYLVLSFEDNSGMTIANCNFQIELPDGVSISQNGDSFKYEEGEAIEGMKVMISSSNNVYTITVYDGVFDKNVDNTIIRLPLQGWSEGEAIVSNIAFDSYDGKSISRPEKFNVNVVGVGIKGDVDGNGSVGLGDIERLLLILAGGASTRAADVDGNGKLGLGDIETILRIMAGGK